MSELEKCKKKIEKCDKLIRSGKDSANFGSTFCEVVGDSMGLFMTPLVPLSTAFDFADMAKRADSKLSKALYYTSAGLAGIVGVAFVAPSALIVGSTYLSLTSVKTARDFRNKKRLNKLINKKQSLEEELKDMEMELN